MSTTTVCPETPAITCFLAEQVRVVHLHHDVLLRQRDAECRSGAAAWQVQSTSRQIEADEAVERYLQGLLRDLGGGSR